MAPNEDDVDPASPHKKCTRSFTYAQTDSSSSLLLLLLPSSLASGHTVGRTDGLTGRPTHFLPEEQSTCLACFPRTSSSSSSAFLESAKKSPRTSVAQRPQQRRYKLSDYLLIIAHSAPLHSSSSVAAARANRERSHRRHYILSSWQLARHWPRSSHPIQADRAV